MEIGVVLGVVLLGLALCALATHHRGCRTYAAREVGDVGVVDHRDAVESDGD